MLISCHQINIFISNFNKKAIKEILSFLEERRKKKEERGKSEE
jgi:hypothetical protein